MRRVRDFKEQGRGFEKVNLYSNGIRIGLEPLFSTSFLLLWRLLGLRTVYVTVHHPEEAVNAKMYGVDKYPDLETVFRRIQAAGLSSRANVVLSKRTIATFDQFRKLMAKLWACGVDSTSVWPVRNMQDQVDAEAGPVQSELDLIADFCKMSSIRYIPAEDREAYQTGKKLTLFFPTVLCLLHGAIEGLPELSFPAVVYSGEKTMGPFISKSKFTAGLQCPKRQYLQIHQPDLDNSEPTSAMREGNLVGAAARVIFPGGVLVETDSLHFDEAIQETLELMADPTVNVLFEAAFQYQHLRARVDVLCRVGLGWRLGIIPDKRTDYVLGEVKASLSVKEHHVSDVSFQAYIMEKLGYKIQDVSLMILNRDYIYAGGEHDLTQLFKMVIINPTSGEEIEAELAKQLVVLQQPNSPAIPMGSQCRNPYDCEFMDHCRGPYIGGDPQYNLEALNLLDGIQFPVHFLDFETIVGGIPIFKGTRPWQQVPIQWSDHVWTEPNACLEHREFLHDSAADPRRVFAESVFHQLGETGTIIVYSSFEHTVLRKLATDFPEFQERFDTVELRIWDLYAMVRKTFNKDDPAFFGSLSIKNVVRALAPEVSYSDLAIRNGDEAITAWKHMIELPKGPEKEQLRRDLAEYCGVDTLAMAKVLIQLVAKRLAKTELCSVG